MSDVPYQSATLVAQLQAERENAVAYGDTGRVARVDKQLAELGVRQKAAEKRQQAAEGAEGDAQAVPPQDRSTRPLETAEVPPKRGPGRPRKSV